ncbi:MAG TPA: DUF2298 domain-containing protein, partial [Aggregatilineales bacterium]|nr:DUF2298 domain-containing protein [Aggregatilineales bacterium]
MLDWIAREGGAVLSWWLIATLAGIAVYPLFFRLVGALPGRGYALVRAAGAMLIGYVYWIVNILGLLRNTPGSIVLVWLAVAIAAWAVYYSWRDRPSLIGWLRDHRALIFSTEAIFALFFVGWCIVRALNPDLSGTEHPMDMAFLSASRHSAFFPPSDPWMSGYAISYYHFGYILMSMFANVSGVSNGIAFNLAISMIFGLAGVSAFGVGYDLVASRLLTRIQSSTQPPRQWPALAIGTLTAVMFLVMGNLGTAFVEVPYQAGAIPANSSYLSWLDLKYRPADLSGCTSSGSANPYSWGCGWWWWAYSRVLNDYDLGSPASANGTAVAARSIGDVITETPTFSFTLSDLHPHVMALPFAMLVVGLSFNLVLVRRRLLWWELGLYGIFAGGMLFLNSWDGVYIVFVVGAEVLRRLIANGTGRLTGRDWRGVVGMGAALLVLTGVLYLPFFLSFRSQAGGPLPNLLWPTQFQQFFIMFGTFIVILGGFLIAEMLRAGNSLNVRGALEVLGYGLGLNVLAFAFLAILALTNPEIHGIVFGAVDTSGGFLPALVLLLQRREIGLVTEGILALFIFGVVARLFSREPRAENGQPEQAHAVITYSPATGFVLLLIGAGAVLTLATDFFYLRDGFGNRMNTVFKLYYQGWLLWSVAGAYGLWSLFAEPVPGVAGPVVRRVFGIAGTLLIVAGMAFPIATVTTHAIRDGGHFEANGSPMTLDGGKTIASGA